VSSNVQPARQPGTSAGSQIYQLKVSAYDRVASLLLALIVLVGMAVGLMFLIWLTSVISFRPAAAQVEPIFDLKGRGEAAEGIARDLEEPGLEELPEMEPQLAETLELIPDVVSSNAAALEAFEGNAAESGSGSGLGDSRARGPGGEGEIDAVPEWERLEARLSSRNLREYITQLDYFGIELGALDRESPRVDYARNFAKTKPDTRTGTRDGENRAGRLYFVHEQSALMQFDRTLLERGGIKTKGRILAQFFPHELRQDLLAKEQARLGGRSLADVRKTVFAIRTTSGGGMEFYVVEQTYR
jgi:hypothetical protein